MRVLSTVLFCLTLTGVADEAASAGAVFGWGLDDDGQATPPDEVNGVSGTATDIATGGQHSLAIAVPEPGVILQLVAGTAGLAFLDKRRVRKKRRAKPTG